MSTKNTAFLLAAVIPGKEFLSFDLEYLLWLRPLHTAEKHHPTMFHTATVRPTTSGQNILYNTSLNENVIIQRTLKTDLDEDVFYQFLQP